MSDENSRRPLRADGRTLPPMDQPGYYPSFSTLGQRAFWDDATRAEVLARVEVVPPMRFFTPEETALLVAVIDRVLPQDDRTEARRIPIVPFIDERLHVGRIDGYRFADMPPDGEAHRLGLRAIEACAQAAFRRGFLALSMAEQEQVLQEIHDGRPRGGHEIWKRMAMHRYWLLLVHDVCQVYYAHPWAWDEIGFGGPAYPRGYMRIEGGQREPWEADEKRYDWRPPPAAKSGEAQPVADNQQYGAPGQGGTH